MKLLNREQTDVQEIRGVTGLTSRDVIEATLVKITFWNQLLTFRNRTIDELIDFTDVTLVSVDIT